MKGQVFSLIEGPFTAAEARDILKSIIHTKINFHKLRILRLTEGDEHADVQSSRDRIKALEQTRAEIMSLLQEANDLDLKVEINSFMELKLKQDEDSDLMQQIEKGDFNEQRTI